MKESAIYGLGTIVTRAVAFLLLPYYSNLMSTTEFGVYSLFMVLVTFAQPLYVHGIDIAFLRYASKAERDDQKRALGRALLQCFFVGGTIAVLISLLAPQIAHVVISSAGPREAMLARMAAGFMLLDTLSNNFFTYLRIRNRAMTFSLLKLMNVLVNIGLNIYMVGTLGRGAQGAFEAFLYTSALVLLVLLLIAGKDIRFSYRWKDIKAWLAFGLPNLPAMIFYVALEFSDRKWIEALMGVDEAGIYSAGYRIGMLMSMVAQAFRFAWQPFFLKNADDEDAPETFARVLTYYLAFSAWIWLGSALLLGYLLKMPIGGERYIIHPDYWEGLKVYPIIMFAHIFNGIYANLMVGVYLKNRTKVIPLVIGAAAVVNIVGNGLLIPHFGYMASAWLTVVSYALMCILMYLYIAPRYHVPYEWDRLIRIGLSTLAFWGVASVAADAASSPVLLFAVRAGLVIALPLLWWVYIGQADEKRAVGRLLQRLRS